MNTTFLAITVPVITGLIVFTYNHYKYGRKLIIVVFILVALIYGSIALHYYSVEDGFERSKHAIEKYHDKALVVNIITNVNEEMKKDTDRFNEIAFYTNMIYLALFVSYSLSFLFEYIKKKELLDKYNNTRR